MHATRQKTVTLVLGGVRSGKSRYAQQLGERAERVVFVATAHASDDEMRDKVERHRSSRPQHWQTIEEPLQLAQTIVGHGASCDLMIIDCLTFFAANLLSAEGESEGLRFASRTLQDLPGEDTRPSEPFIDELCATLASPPCSVVLVSNEVGSGVVPPYPSGRQFRDLLGELNQRVAGVATDVLLLVAGLPLVLKGQSVVQP